MMLYKQKPVHQVENYKDHWSTNTLNKLILISLQTVSDTGFTTLKVLKLKVGRYLTRFDVSVFRGHKINHLENSIHIRYVEKKFLRFSRTRV